MSCMHLGRFSLTHLEQHRARHIDTHELDVFCARDCLPCCIMGHLLRSKKYPLDQRVIMRVSRLQQFFFFFG